MHSFQNFIVWLIPNHPLPLETRIWKLVVRALAETFGTVGEIFARKKNFAVWHVCFVVNCRSDRL